jgi:hypothetical protein
MSNEQLTMSNEQKERHAERNEVEPKHLARFVERGCSID